MSKMSVLEISRRLKRLDEIGKIMGFSVTNCEDYMEWSSKDIGTYCIFPYFDITDSMQTPDIGLPVIPVCISDNDTQIHIDNCIHLNDLEILVEYVGKDKSQNSRLLLYWKLMYGKKSISDLVDLLKDDMDTIRIDKNDNHKKLSKKDDKMASEKQHKEKDSYDFNKLICQLVGTELSPLGHKFFENANGSTVYLELLSKVYPRAKGFSEYWYSIHSYQIQKLKSYSEGYYMFCMSECHAVLCMSREYFDSVKDNLTTSPNKGDVYWHIKIFMKDNNFWLQTKNGRIEITDQVEGMNILSEDETEDLQDDVILIRNGKNREVNIKRK